MTPRSRDSYTVRLPGDQLDAAVGGAGRPGSAPRPRLRSDSPSCSSTAASAWISTVISPTRRSRWKCRAGPRTSASTSEARVTSATRVQGTLSAASLRLAR